MFVLASDIQLSARNVSFCVQLHRKAGFSSAVTDIPNLDSLQVDINFMFIGFLLPYIC